MSSRDLSVSANWNDVWAEYDARQPLPAALVSRPHAMNSATFATGRVPANAARRSGRFGWSALLAAPLLAAGWLSAPYATAWTLVKAIEGREAQELAKYVDATALQDSVRNSLRLNANAPQDGPAGDYLRAMAREIGEAWSNPAALAEVVRARGVGRGTAAQALRATIPTGLTRFEMPLRGTVAPVTLQLQLSGEILAPRWQVTGVRLEQMSAMPAVGGRPSGWLSAQR